MKTRITAKPKAGGAKAAGADGSTAPLPYGMARTIALNLPEFAPVVERLGLQPANRVSPLPELMKPGAKGKPRPVEELLAPVSRLDPDTAAWIFNPLAIPDRILDMRGTSFNGAPTLCRWYSNRLFPAFFAGLRPALETDYELVAPFSAIDFEVWTRLQLQMSAGQPLPAPSVEISGLDLAFLLNLADAHKAAFGRSWAERQDAPTPVRITQGDILAAQAASQASADRRWAAKAVGELFEAMIRPGGGTGIGLPVLDAKAVTAQVQRYAKEGMLLNFGSGKDPSFELGPTLSMWATSLFTWINLMSLHDLQVTGLQRGRVKTQEDCIILVVTEATTWAIVSDDLGQPAADVGSAKFQLRALTIPDACRIVAGFVGPLPGLSLPDEIYDPVDGGEVTASAPPGPPAPAPRRTARPAAPWKATHVIPAGGLDTWEKPDPDAKPSDELEEGIEVQVAERLGDWARVICDNGWTGWIDGRDLEEV